MLQRVLPLETLLYQHPVAGYRRVKALPATFPGASLSVTSGYTCMTLTLNRLELTSGSLYIWRSTRQRTPQGLLEMVSAYAWVIVGAGALLVAYVAFTFIKMYLDDRERRRREAEGGGPYSSSSDNENGYLGLSAFRDCRGNDAGGLELVREGGDKGGVDCAAASA
ncbi:unnamed protein product [Phytophthora fragariaefolia]|uniref:Unnamed protein product n=1 Tax=Phytophthora fragariaefolia TaxID=1490495 RepID=A0A9W6XMB7_9STRA|nr:unnamed protein product [Phytophthora fragariaefolia]